LNGHIRENAEDRNLLHPPGAPAAARKLYADGYSVAGAQAEADYGVPKGLTLRDEIARYFRIGQALFADLSASKTPSHAATVAFIQRLLHDVFGFADVSRSSTGRRRPALRLLERPVPCGTRFARSL
jgi:hypothetical protein